jgi:hypothetical protein
MLPRSVAATHLVVHHGTGSSGGIALLKATPLNLGHVTVVDLGVKPSLDGCLAVSNMTADSVACWALAAVPPPVQGVNRHAENLR